MVLGRGFLSSRLSGYQDRPSPSSIFYKLRYNLSTDYCRLFDVPIGLTFTTRLPAFSALQVVKEFTPRGIHFELNYDFSPCFLCWLPHKSYHNWHKTSIVQEIIPLIYNFSYLFANFLLCFSQFLEPFFFLDNFFCSILILFKVLS